MEMSHVLTVELALLLQVAAQGAALAHVWAEKTSLKKRAGPAAALLTQLRGYLLLLVLEKQQK